MKKLLTSPYFIGYAILYLVVLTLMASIYDYQVSQAIAVVIVIGILFSSVAYLTSKSSKPISIPSPPQKREVLLLALLIAYITLGLTFGIDFIKNSFAAPFERDLRVKEIVTLAYKILLFVGIPLAVYKLSYKFDLKEFGLKPSTKELFTKRNGIILISMALVLSAFQLFAGNGAKPIRDGLISSNQLLVGLPLLFAWLVLEVGLVEEFFYRALLQSRLSVLTKSEIGGIVLSGLLFGLSHAPGFYLRGGGAIDGLGTNPTLFMSIGYSIVVLSVAGFFLSIVWSKTRNLWLVAAIHAFVDLLPSLPEFLSIWNIQ